MTYKVVDKHSVDSSTQDLPKHLLGETIKEAEEVYNEYSSLLNSIAYTYSITTGLDKSDLFAEAVFGLARAKKDFDPNRSEDFSIYAIFIIKDTLNEYIRYNANTIAIPSYLKKASSLFERLRNVLETGNVSVDALLDVLEYGETNKDVPQEIFDRCTDLLDKLHRSAERAGIEYIELINRIQLLPERGEYIEESPDEVNESVDNSILVEQLMSRMTEEEKTIAKGIMEDKSYEEIGKSMGKTKAWVSLKVKDMREKLS